MIPENIDEKDFRYTRVSNEDAKEFYENFMDILESFMKFMDIKEDINVVRPVIGRICERVDQRKDYYLYYHSDEQTVMHMSHEKEVALWIYWICKYKPIHFKKITEEEKFFSENGCTLSDAFAVYMIICIVIVNDQSKADCFTDDRINDLYYEMANRDFSKEAIIARINDLLQ